MACFSGAVLACRDYELRHIREGVTNVNTDQYCLLRILALSFEALNKRPLSFNGAMPAESLSMTFDVIPKPLLF